MTLGGTLRIVALGCILASLPLGLLKYPWLPATVMEFIELQHDPAPWGSPSYHEGREARRERVESALLLYFLGTLSLCGLLAITAKVLPWAAESAAWVATAVSGLGIAQFDKANIGPTTLVAYTSMAVYTPLAISAIAALAAVLSFALQVWSKRSSRASKA